MENRYLHYFYKENFVKEVVRDIEEENRKKQSGNDNDNIQGASLQELADAIEDIS